jgi:hypothetical protein
MGNRGPFCSPFSSIEEVQPLLDEHREDDAKAKISDRQAFAAGRELLDCVKVRENMGIVFRWKLQSFLRFPWVRAFPEESSDQEIDYAVAKARDAQKSDKTSVCEALHALDGLRRVGIPVASAFLTAMRPDQFTVMDRQAFRALKAAFRPNVPGYLTYLEFCHQEAKRLGVTLREHDEALWHFGKKMVRRGRSDSN